MVRIDSLFEVVAFFGSDVIHLITLCIIVRPFLRLRLVNPATGSNAA